MKRKSTLLIFLLAGAYLASAQTRGGYELAITEINYHPDSSWQSQDWIELYNYGASEIDISGWYLKDETPINEYIFPSGSIIQPGQYKIVAQRTDTFSMIYPDVTGVLGPFEFGLGNGGGLIRLLDDAGVPVIQIAYADTLPWPVSPDGYGPTLEVQDPTDNLNDPDNWFGGCVGGSPGGPYTDCNYGIQVSEINYNSIFFHDSGDWIELVNSSAAPVDISNWRVRDANDNNQFIIPAGTVLEPDAHLVIVQDIFQFFTYYSSMDPVIGDMGFGYSGQGDALRIYDADLRLRYGLYYHDDPPWPDDADGNGYTMELVDFFGTPNVAGAWTSGCIYGSPTTAIQLPCPTSIETYTALPFTVGPNPFSNYLLIDLSAIGFSNVNRVTIYDISGRMVHTILPVQDQLLWDGNNNIGIALPSGLYMLHVQLADGSYHAMQIIKE